MEKNISVLDVEVTVNIVWNLFLLASVLGLIFEVIFLRDEIEKLKRLINFD